MTLHPTRRSQPGGRGRPFDRCGCGPEDGRRPVWSPGRPAWIRRARCIAWVHPGVRMRAWLAVGTVLFAQIVFAGGDSPCPHPYFPMGEGLKLTYRAGKSEVAVTFSDVHGTALEQRGTLHMSHKGRDGSAVATCSADGIRTDFGGLEGAVLSLSGLDVKAVSSEGIAMPPPAQFLPGARWANTLSLELRPPS